MAWHLKVKILNMKNIYNGCFHNRISVKSSTRSGVPAIWRTRRWSCSTTWHSSSGRCSSPSSPSPTTSTWAAPSCPWLWIYTKENSNQGIGYGQWRGNIERWIACRVDNKNAEVFVKHHELIFLWGKWMKMTHYFCHPLPSKTFHSCSLKIKLRVEEGCQRFQTDFNLLYI